MIAEEPDAPAPLHPAVAAAVTNLPPVLDAAQGLGALLAQHPRPSFDDLPPAPARTPAVATSDISVSSLGGDAPAVPARLYRRAGPQAVLGPPVMILHGGGFILGHPATADAVLLDAAAAHDLLILAPAYRLAPAHPFPAALDDARAAHRWLSATAPEHGADPSRLVVFGFSAGGGLAAAMALHRRDHGGPPVARLVLASPALDDRLTTTSAHAVTDPRLWNRRVARLAWDAYLAEIDPTGPLGCYAAPARAANLHGLPPTVVTVNDHDLLRDEGLAFGLRLAAAGVRVDLHHLGGTVHGSLGMAPDAAISRRELSVLLRAMAAA